MTEPRYRVVEQNGWSYVEGEPKPRDAGPWRYRWEAQEYADDLNALRKIPIFLLTDDEIARLAPKDQEWVRNVKARRAREDACPGHEAVSTGTHAEAMRGWHPAKCKHCGIDMSIDSGD